jgi:hypothetical protein
VVVCFSLLLGCSEKWIFCWKLLHILNIHERRWSKETTNFSMKNYTIKIIVDSWTENALLKKKTVCDWKVYCLWVYVKGAQHPFERNRAF